MTELAHEAPTLTWGREQTQAWTQAVLSLGSLLRQRREATGRMAWSDAEDSARQHERVLRAAEPPVRSMTPHERELFDTRRSDEAADDVVTRVVDADDWSVTVTLGRLPDENGWGLVAHGRSNGGTDTCSTQVRCADESTATKLGEQLLQEGPQKIERLNGFAEHTAARARAASTEVRETEPQRLARTAATVRQLWPRELAERVIGPTTDQRNRGERWNPAFGALAWRLHEMEERGFAMADVLRRVDHTRLMENEVRNPAALAEFFIEEMMPGLQVINLDSEQFAARPRSPGVSRDSASPSADIVEQEQTVGPFLAEALPGELLERLRRGQGYDGLRQRLFEQHEKGRPVAELLAGLPIDRISAADKPAQYLKAVLDRRIGDGKPPRTGSDRNAQAEFLRAHLGHAAADRIISGSAWPGLAKRLEAWRGDQIPVGSLIEQLPEGRVAAARNPAAYATTLLTTKVRSHRASAAREKDTSTSRTDGPRGEQRTGDPATASPTDVVEQATPQQSSELPPAEELDPRSPVDRVGLDVVAVGRHPSPEQRARSTEAAGHRAAAEAATGRAEEHERLAAAHREPSAGQPGQPEEREHDGAALIEDNLAAGERAIAASERGAEAAAATRAEVTYTPPASDLSQAGQPAVKRPASAAHRPVRQQQPGKAQERGRTR
ncbi:hypothetical protein [Pseudonocardia sp. WMMC193]|uniref:hypothetical protein n=1 Tax=Pseudonocardia sp. WMMC193 TaxID=2911965 RepID=UPI001F1E8056|nr:hypothetical protein [Pseudonocardia sp. WMMC193]MCF7547218.1 hypothetical protein [Pseudonocardia sp. WMMC193]